MRLSLFILCFFTVFTSYASTTEQKIDSIENVVRTTKNDSIKCSSIVSLFDYYSDRDSVKSQQCISQMAKLYREKNYKPAEPEVFNMLGILKKNKGETDSAIYYQNKAEALYRKGNQIERLAYCLMNSGNNYKRKGELPTASKKFKEAIEISRKINNRDILASNLLNLGLLEQELSNTNIVFQYYFEALKLFEELKSDKKYVICCINISTLLSDQKKYDESLKYLNMALEKTKTNPRILAAIYGNMANNFMQKEEYEKAIDYYKKSSVESEKAGNFNSVALVNSNLGVMYTKIKKYDLAIQHLKKAEKEFITEDSKIDLCEVYMHMGNAYNEANKPQEAIYYLTKAIDISDSHNFTFNRVNCYLYLAKAYANNNDKKSAYTFALKYIELKDSLTEAENREAMLKIQTVYETEKKELAIKNLQSEKKLKDVELTKSALEIKKQNQLKLFFGIGFILVAVLALFIYKSLRQKHKANIIISNQKKEVEKQKEIVEEQHKEITDSINYAQRIQKALLPAQSDFNKLFPESFVSLLPRNTVSGDFYWISKQDNYLYYVTADCTGHGVPGGFMSMLGLSALNQLVNEKKILSPAKILDQLRDIIISSLKQTGVSGDSQDGMDLCLCRIDITTNKLVYAAANNSLYIVKNKQITEYKGDKQPIGYYNGSLSPFNEFEIQLEKGDLLYTTTDGYPDQFGGEKGKKFRYKNFEELLVQLSDLPLAIQKEKLVQHFYEWKKDFEQTDDVCVIGVKI